MSDAKLFVLNTPPVKPTVTNTTVAADLRELAAEVEQGVFGDVDLVISVLENSEGNLARALCGERVSRSRVCGLLTWSAHNLMNRC